MILNSRILLLVFYYIYTHIISCCKVIFVGGRYLKIVCLLVNPFCFAFPLLCRTTINLCRKFWTHCYTDFSGVLVVTPQTWNGQSIWCYTFSSVIIVSFLNFFGWTCRSWATIWYIYLYWYIRWHVRMICKLLIKY